MKVLRDRAIEVRFKHDIDTTISLLNSLGFTDNVLGQNRPVCKEDSFDVFCAIKTTPESDVAICIDHTEVCELYAYRYIGKQTDHKLVEYLDAYNFYLELVEQDVLVETNVNTSQEAIATLLSLLVPWPVTKDCVVLEPISKVCPNEAMIFQDLTDKNTPRVLLQLGVNELGSQTGLCQRCGEQQCEADNRHYCGDCGQALKWRAV